MKRNPCHCHKCINNGLIPDGNESVVVLRREAWAHALVRVKAWLSAKGIPEARA